MPTWNDLVYRTENPLVCCLVGPLVFLAFLLPIVFGALIGGVIGVIVAGCVILGAVIVLLVVVIRRGLRGQWAPAPKRRTRRHRTGRW